MDFANVVLKGVDAGVVAAVEHSHPDVTAADDLPESMGYPLEQGNSHWRCSGSHCCSPPRSSSHSLMFRQKELLGSHFWMLDV